MSTRRLSLWSLFLAITLTGCAAQQRGSTVTNTAASSTTKTISDSTLLEQASKDHSRWVSDALKSGKYKHIMIDAVAMKPMPKNLTADQQGQLKELFAVFDKILRAEMSQRISVVSTSGADVARLQPTITSVTSSTQGMKAYEVIPIAAILGGIKAATGTRAKEIEISLLANVIDSQTSEVLATVVRRGTADQADRMQASVEDVREILTEWAKQGAKNVAGLFN
ncbi:MAG: DUF3313 domain-containing protein [Immundisolibacteraceae bacterium]|nr:DUF3313 domain-containing protein [Immundisolibacteraceae bacterium]